MAIRAGGNGVTISVDGEDELARRLRALAEAVSVREAIEAALTPAGQIVMDAQIARAPFRTGQLAGSITISKLGRGSEPSIRVGPSGRGFYGRYLEYGTSKMAARPWIRPAFDSVRSEVERAVAEGLWKLVTDNVK